MGKELSSDEITSHLEAIAKQGYTILEGVLSAAELQTLNSELASLEARLEAKPNNNFFEGHNTIRVYNLLVHGEHFVNLSHHPAVLPIIERVLSKECLISSLSSIGILPGEKAQPIHADDQTIPIAKPHQAIICNTMWALTDFTEENGATRIIPGSHTRDQSPSFGTEYETEAAVMKAGSVMIFNGSIWHGGGANTSEQRRTGIAMNYCDGYIRQQENQQLGVPRELVKTMPRRVQELIGYSIYRGLIGHLDHGHPKALLE